MTPQTSQRAAFEEDRRADAGAVVDAEPLNIEYGAGYGLVLLLHC
jgi:hypothetical protein